MVTIKGIKVGDREPIITFKISDDTIDCDGVLETWLCTIGKHEQIVACED